MNDELPSPTKGTSPRRSLEQRLARRPDLLARLHQIVDHLDQSITDGSDADQAEARVIEQVRQLGHQWLTNWAEEANEHTQAQVPAQHPHASRHGKKKLLSWQTTFGWIQVQEAQWRLGRRGTVLRPFCVRAGVRPRGDSRRLQRVLVDFGAEDSFAQAAQRVQEHYGIDVSVGRVRRHSLLHGARMSALERVAPQQAARTLVTEMDGTMIPIAVPPAAGADRRKGKQLLWREARLCLAREKDSATPCYGASLGSAELAGTLWAQTARAAGLGPQTCVHGLGDGAGWILTQFGEQFGSQGTYLVDFYHTSEYLVAAAAIVQPQNPVGWRRRQQGRLLDNKVPAVLRALGNYLEPEGGPDAPVRTAHRYLDERRGHLDYAGARAAGLPIGSGEIESGHRHVIQQRLKRAGAWWKEPNAEAMLGLRVARANHLWDTYWTLPTSTQN